MRRSLHVSGFVKFPVTDPAYKNTNEGGMFVRLLVRAPAIACPLECCGGYNFFEMDASLIGEDVSRRPDSDEPPTSAEELQEYVDADSAWMRERFPKLDTKDQGRYVSAPMLAVVTLGSTGWSGWHLARREYFRCQFTDLTEHGQVLHRVLAKLYPECDVVLQTWLDT